MYSCTQGRWINRISFGKKKKNFGVVIFGKMSMRGYYLRGRDEGEAASTSSPSVSLTVVLVTYDKGRQEGGIDAIIIRIVN
jgi:hypothetical protein